MYTLKRRDFLWQGAIAGSTALIGARYAFAAPERGDKRFVCIIMRGALDGLAAVPPHGDAAYAQLRRDLAIAPPGAAGGALPLDHTFGLNPGLGFMHECYGAGELAVLHAVASPYRERSHFDGQDVLENGSAVPHSLQTGWLNRALAAMPRGNVRGKEAGVALGQNVPLLMRGPAAVASWSPSVLPNLDDDTMQRIADRYATDPLLAQRLADALSTNEIADEARTQDGSNMGAERANSAADSGGASGGDKAGGNGLRGRYAAIGETVRTAGGFLKRDDGPAVAVFDTTGWDTHANEGNAQGQLTQRLTALDGGLRTLKDSLGSTWQRTAVLIVTEFGRTAATNGTRGTDHGTGAAAFLLGGAVRGGRVISDWPGLAANALYQGRDLKPTTDLRAVMKGVLADHLGVPLAALDREVFPDSASVKPMRDLLRS
jgi:uncharacterized protein (DUF1501 family)